MQFDYGLRQQRHKKLEDRPATFVTAEGKTIDVVQDVAAKNNRTVSRGKVGPLATRKSSRSNAYACSLYTKSLSEKYNPIKWLSRSQPRKSAGR